MKALSYQLARPMMKVGDLIAFSGNGIISKAISFFTRCPVSHVAAVDRPGERVEIIESTTLNGKQGVQRGYLSERIESYDGSIWWLPLRHNPEPDHFISAMAECEGRKYDFGLIRHFALDSLKLFAQREDISKLICSELIAYGYKECRVLPSWINSSTIRPVDLIRFSLWRDVYQLKGPLTDLKGLGTINPKEWRNR